jgi:hypothetical protein
MTLHRNRQFQRLGLAEFLAIVLLGSAALAITLWWQERMEPRYEETEGHVVDGQLSLVHYNAEDTRQKVSLAYEYAVGPKTYQNSWVGFWPEFGSSNALPPSQLEALCTKGHALVVLYSSEDPNESYLYPLDGGRSLLYGGIALGACAAAVIYCGVVYPSRRFRR